MAEAHYDVMQVCENGHKITEMAQSCPEFTQEYCSDCGAKTISACPKCNTNIRGELIDSGVISVEGTPVPAFCHACGAPHPWTAKKLEAAKELADETEGLDPEEVETLKGSLNDLIRETPKTPVAIVRFKRLVAKAGGYAGQAFRAILVDVLSEAVKEQIWPT